MQKYTKAIVAVIGSVCAWAGLEYSQEMVHMWAMTLTPVAVWLFPNKH